MDLRRLPHRTVLIVAAATVLTALPGKSATLQFAWPWLVWTQALLLCVPALLILRAAAQPGHCLRTPLVVLAVLSAVVPVVSSLASVQPAFSLGAALAYVALPCWIVLLASVRLEPRERSDGGNGSEDGPAPIRAWPDRMDTLAALIACLPLVFSLGMWLPEAVGTLGSPGGLIAMLTGHPPRNAHPFGHWNHLGGYCVLVLPLLAAAVIRARAEPFARSVRGLTVGGVFLAFLLLYTSQSRGALLGVGVSAATVVALAAWRGSLSRKVLVRTLAGALAIAVVLVAANPRLRSLILNPTSAAELSVGDAQRAAMLAATPELIGSAPLLGAGPGRVPYVYPEVRGGLAGGVESAYQLHSLPPQLAVELGIGGAVLFVAPLLWVLVRRLRELAAARASGGAIGSAQDLSFAAIVGYGVFSLTDAQLDVPVIVLLLAWHAAALVPAAVFREIPPRPSRVAQALVACVGSMALVAGLWKLNGQWQSRRELAEAQALQDAGQLLEARVAFERAAAYGGDTVHPRNRLGFHLALEAASATDPAQRELLRAHALDALAVSLTIEPAQEPVRAARGWLLLAADPVAAEAEFRAALRLLPGREGSLAGLGMALEAQGRGVAAARALAFACAANPSLVLSPAWSRPPLMALRGEVLSRLPTALAKVAGHNRGAELAFLNESQGILGLVLSEPGTSGTQAGLAGLLSGPVGAYVARLPEGPERAEVQAVVDARTALGVGERLVDHLRAPYPPGTPPRVRILFRQHHALFARVPEDPGYPDLWPRETDPLAEALFGARLTPPRFVAPVIPVELVEEATR